MTPTQARAFLAVATKGSFSEAARSLRVSQPTVTSQVKEIEKDYGIELFRRNGRGALLTPVGESLLPSIRRMFSSYEEANALLSELNGMRRGTLRIGSYGPFDVIKIIGRYQRRFPSVTLSVDFSNSEILAAKLGNYDVDIAVLGRLKHQPQFYTLPFRQPPLIVIAPRNAKWDDRKSVSAAELKNEIIIRRERGSVAGATHDRFIGRVKVPPSHIFQFGSREGVISAVAEGIGVATVIDEGYFPEDRIVKLKIDGPPLASKVDVVCLADRCSSPLIADFIDIAKEIIRER